MQLNRLAAFACALVVAAAALAVAVPLSSADSGPGAGASIIGGQPASIEAYPSLAYIAGEDATGGFGCTGTVVAPRVVLTAGHCVENLEAEALYPAGGFAVITGAANLNRISRSQVAAVDQAVVYPGFRPARLRGDAGLLVLAEPVAAPPLALATSADASLYAGGAAIEIAGWGRTNPRVPGGTAKLQAAASVVLAPEECERRTKSYEPSYSTALQLCAVDIPTRKRGACHGDSGGPAIAKRADGVPVQLGIISTGGPNCNVALPNVFTRVDAVSAWVASWIAATETGAPAPALAKLRPRVPLLSFPQARELSAAALENDFKQRFRNSRDRQIGCDRVAKAKVKCAVSWDQGGNHYFGSITTYYVIDEGSVAWDFRYEIHRANQRCLSRSDQPCVVRTQAR